MPVANFDELCQRQPDRDGTIEFLRVTSIATDSFDTNYDFGPLVSSSRRLGD